jgi:hypothetical protein
MTGRHAGGPEPVDGPPSAAQPRRALAGLAVAGLIVLGGIVFFMPHAATLVPTASPPGSVAAASGSPTPPPVVAILPVPSLDLDASSGVLAQGEVSGTAAGAGIEAQVFVTSIDQPGPFVVDLACAGPGSITWLAAVHADQTQVATATHPCGATSHDVDAAGLAAPFDVSVTADGAASWSWAVSVLAAPTTAGPPTPTPGPTPACPPAEPYGSFPPPPVLTLTGGGQAVVGDAWSDSFLACTGGAGSDGVPVIPLLGLKVHRADALTISVGDGMTLFEVSRAQYAAAVGTVAPPDRQDLAIQAGPAPGTYYLDTPPVGDWVVLVTVAVNDVVHGAVWSQIVDFRVTVTL